MSKPNQLIKVLIKWLIMRDLLDIKDMLISLTKLNLVD